LQFHGDLATLRQPPVDNCAIGACSEALGEGRLARMYFCRTGIRAAQVMPMRCAQFAAALLLVIAPAALAESRFDGAWQTTVSCQESRGGLGYSIRLVSTVTNGVLHGQRGTPGQPSSLTLEGTITPDGTAPLFATGYVGGREFTPGSEIERGTQFSYHINAHFSGNTGTGARVEGRPCTYEFVRQ
jgi:hypothetical protein